MGLQAWLPLNKDTRNVGLTDVDATNCGATLTTGGVYNTKCYFFDGTDDYINLHYNSFGSNFSISLWFYRLNNNAVWIFCSRNKAYGGVGLYVDSSTSNIAIDCASNPNSNSRWKTSTVISNNTWYQDNSSQIQAQAHLQGHN